MWAKLMRYPIVLLICFTLFACGKTGALFLPEEPPEPTSEPAQQNEQTPKQETGNSENAD